MIASATKIRRAVPISAFIGANGSGKSALATESLRHSLLEGRPVLSAVRLMDPRKAGQPCEHPLCDVEGHGEPGHVPSADGWTPLRKLSQLLEFEHGDIFLDEVGAIVSSRQSSGMPPQIEALLQQLRKRDVRLVWTAPSWARADKILREVTMLATVCKGYGDARIEGREWRRRRWIHAASYHAADLDDFEISKVNSPHAVNPPRKVTSQWVRVLKLESVAWYDTFEPVPVVGFLGMGGGSCVDCGGRMSPVRCECPDTRRPVKTRAPIELVGVPPGELAG